MNHKFGLALQSCVLMAALLAGAATAARGADDASAATTQPSERRRPGEVLQRIKEALAKLDLTADQKVKTDAILSDARAQLLALRSAPKTGDRAAAMNKVRQIMQGVREKLGAVLTPEQKKKLREIREEREDGGETPTTQN